MPRITVGSLKESTGVTDDQLDKKCSEAHLKFLTPDIGNYTKFASALGLSDNEIGSINTNQLWDFQQRTEKVLLLWRNIASNATYRSFVQTCISLSEGVVARKMCELCAEGIYRKLRIKWSSSVTTFNMYILGVHLNALLVASYIYK